MPGTRGAGIAWAGGSTTETGASGIAGTGSGNPGTPASGRRSNDAGEGAAATLDAALAAVCARAQPAVFCLWGNHARKKARLVDTSRHGLVEGAHPSPLSVARFRGSRPFSAINAALVARGVSPIDWARAGAADWQP